MSIKGLRIYYFQRLLLIIEIPRKFVKAPRENFSKDNSPLELNI
jgi:hypothetical protein